MLDAIHNGVKKDLNSEKRISDNGETYETIINGVGENARLLIPAKLTNIYQTWFCNNLK